MLKYAQELYGGEIDITGYAITQGSYSDSENASFGTHSGGGAVDLSVMREGTYTVLYNEIYSLVLALRTAGFAAWFRDFDELYDGSPVHIHAIAIGDDQLSQSAKEQLDGEYGYFLGYSGLPASNGYPSADRYGGAIYCDWMNKMGYPDVFAATEYSNRLDWQSKIIEGYDSYTTLSWEETILKAHNELNLFYVTRR